MTRGGVVHPALKPSDVHSTGTKRDETKHFKEDKRAYTQVYLARARIEGIERWRAAVDAALQPATEGGEEQETKMNRWSADETVKQPKMEATGDVPVEVLERESTAQVEGTKQKRRGRRHELWKGLRNTLFIF